MSIAEQESKEKVKLLKPKNDIVFQCLFNQNNERITKAFVQALLDKQIEKILTDKIEIHIIELKKVRNTYEQNKEIAEKLLKRNMSIEDIADITGMSVKEIEEISKNVK